MTKVLLPCPMCGEELIHRVEHFNDPESNDLHTAYCHCGFCFSDDSNSNDEFLSLCNRRATNWTPCSVLSPEPNAKNSRGNDQIYICTIASEYRDTGIVRKYGYGSHIGFDGHDCVGWYYLDRFKGSVDKDITVVAWMPEPEPYTGDHIRNTTKMIQDQVCPKCNSMTHYDPYFGRVVCRQCGWTERKSREGERK